MKTVTVKLYNSEYTPQLHDTVNIAGIIWNTAIMEHGHHHPQGFLR